MSKFLVTTDTGPLFDLLLDKAGIEKTHTRRLILDLEVGSPGMLYAEMFADSELLSIELPHGFQVGLIERKENSA